MLASQLNKAAAQAAAQKRVPVTLSLPAWVAKKLNRLAKQQSTDEAMCSRSDVAAKILEEALR